MNRILLAHSGAPETANAIAWLAETYRAQVATLTLDLGQGARLDAVHARALTSGAVRAHVIDAREEFARAFVFPALRAAALAGEALPDLRALSRAIVARHLLEIARIEEARTVAYGGRYGADDHPMTPLLRSLNPSIEPLALARPAEVRASVEANLLGRRVEGWTLDEQAPGLPEDLFVLTRAPEEAPEIPASVELAFERAIPVAINGVEMSPVELIQSLQTIAGAHGIGRTLSDAARESGARVIHEAPAALALHTAYAVLQDREAGVVHLTFHKGECRIAEPHAARTPSASERNASEPARTERGSGPPRVSAWGGRGGEAPRKRT